MTDAEIVEALDFLPDRIADALARFKTAGIEKERVYAKTYLEIKARSAGSKVTVSEIDAMVKADLSYYEAALEEVKAESAWMALHERLMAAKKQSSMRTAF